VTNNITSNYVTPYSDTNATTNSSNTQIRSFTIKADIIFELQNYPD